MDRSFPLLLQILYRMVQLGQISISVNKGLLLGPDDSLELLQLAIEPGERRPFLFKLLVRGLIRPLFITLSQYQPRKQCDQNTCSFATRCSSFSSSFRSLAPPATTSSSVAFAVVISICICSVVFISISSSTTGMKMADLTPASQSAAPSVFLSPLQHVSVAPLSASEYRPRTTH